MALTKVSTGMLKGDAADVDLSIDGNTFYIDSSANLVGIGTSSPDEILHVERVSGTTLVKTEVAANSIVGFEIAKTGTTTQSWRIVDGQTVNGRLEIYDVTDSRSVMTFDGSGNVGIGTTSPSSKLHVEGALTLLGLGESDGVNIIKMGEGTNADEFRLVGNFAGSGPTGNNITFTSDLGGEKNIMTLRGDGHVGIGTTNPVEDLVILGADTGSVFLQIGNDTTTVADNSGLYVGLDANSDGYVGTRHNADLIFETNDVEAMRIDSSGNVITGSDTANNTTAVTLRQDGTVHANNLQVANAAGSTGVITPSIYSPASATLAISTNSAERLRIDSSGDVSIGDASAEGAKLHIRTANATTYNAASASGADGVNLIVHNDDPTANTTAGIILRTQVSASFADARINCLGVSQNNSAMTFHTEGSGTIAEAMRIDASGNLLVGKTNTGLANDGHVLEENGTAYHTRASANLLVLNRTTTDGSLIDFRKDGVNVGNIGSRSGKPVFIND